MTDKSLIELGIYNCLECGYLNALENSTCKNCGTSKFIVLHDIKKNDDHDIEPIKFDTKPLFNFHDKPKLRDKIYEIPRVNPYKSEKI